MPHFILEYSANLKQRGLEIDSLFARLHEEAVAIGIFPLGGIRSRALCCEQYRIADGDPELAFVHLTAKVGHGRDAAVLQSAGERLFAVLSDHLSAIFERSYLGISFEMVELHPHLNFKQNNIHQKFRAA